MKTRFLIGDGEPHALEVTHSIFSRPFFPITRIRVDGQEVVRKRGLVFPHTFHFATGGKVPDQVDVSLNPILMGQGKVWVNGKCLGRLFPIRALALRILAFLGLIPLVLIFSFFFVGGVLFRDTLPPLSAAVSYGWVYPTKALLWLGFDPNIEPRDSTLTPLDCAVGNDDVELVRILLKAGANPKARDKESLTPLHLAAGGGDAACVRLLLASGADPNARNDFDRTPLHNAAFVGSAECAKLLLAAGADPTAWDKKHRTPLQTAIWKQHPEVVKVLSRP